MGTLETWKGKAYLLRIDKHRDEMEWLVNDTDVGVNKRCEASVGLIRLGKPKLLCLANLGTSQAIYMKWAVGQH